MCVACTSVDIDQGKRDAFAGRLMGMMNEGALAMMLALGHRTGVFDAMGRLDGFATSQQIADEAGLSERYVREWLGAMTNGRIVEHDPQTLAYRLPPEHAAWLTRAAAPNNLAASMQFFAVLGSADDQIAQAFRDGKGVPYSAYHRFNDVMAEESFQTVVSALDEHILPLAPGLQDRLTGGDRRAGHRLRPGQGDDAPRPAVPGQPIHRLGHAR